MFTIANWHDAETEYTVLHQYKKTLKLKKKNTISVNLKSISFDVTINWNKNFIACLVNSG